MLFSQADAIYPSPVRSEVDRALTFWTEIERATGRLPYPMTETLRDGVPHSDWLYQCAGWKNTLMDRITGTVKFFNFSKGFGFVQSKPASAFTPVAVTPDELGAAFDGAKINLPLLSFINGKPFGKPVAGSDMTFDFPTLIAHAAKTRALGAGTILGSGTVSNRDADGGPGKPVEEGGLGYSCIAEQRTVETIRLGKPVTPFLTFGDRVRIEMRDAQDRSIFGAIEQDVVRSA